VKEGKGVLLMYSVAGKWVCKIEGEKIGFLKFIIKNRDAPKGRGAAKLPPSPNPPKRKFKNTDSVDVMISNVLRDFPFSRKQPLKSSGN
jgi:hypothetical protein